MVWYSLRNSLTLVLKLADQLQITIILSITSINQTKSSATRCQQFALHSSSHAPWKTQQVPSNTSSNRNCISSTVLTFPVYQNTNIIHKLTHLQLFCILLLIDITIIYLTYCWKMQYEDYKWAKTNYKYILQALIIGFL